jgi:hypothetical protein
MLVSTLACMLLRQHAAVTNNMVACHAADARICSPAGDAGAWKREVVPRRDRAPRTSTDCLPVHYLNRIRSCAVSGWSVACSYQRVPDQPGVTKLRILFDKGPAGPTTTSCS